MMATLNKIEAFLTWVQRNALRQSLFDLLIIIPLVTALSRAVFGHMNSDAAIAAFALYRANEALAARAKGGAE